MMSNNIDIVDLLLVRFEDRRVLLNFASRKSLETNLQIFLYYAISNEISVYFG